MLLRVERAVPKPVLSASAQVGFSAGRSPGGAGAATEGERVRVRANADAPATRRRSIPSPYPEAGAPNGRCAGGQPWAPCERQYSFSAALVLTNHTIAPTKKNQPSRMYQRPVVALTGASWPRRS